MVLYDGAGHIAGFLRLGLGQKVIYVTINSYVSLRVPLKKREAWVSHLASRKTGKFGYTRFTCISLPPTMCSFRHDCQPIMPPLILIVQHIVTA
eukprot:scaffold3013_cov112-Skeletonema_marinoi.AAC.4